MKRLNLGRNILLTLVMGASLSACGFHLSGSQTNSGMINSQALNYSLAITGNTDNELIDLVKAQKHAIVRYEPSETADIILDVGAINTTKSVLSTNAQGTATEYRVGMSVIIQVYDDQKHQLLAPTRLSTSRNLIVGRGYVTAEDAEQERLNTDMAQELANSIVYRMRAAWLAKSQQGTQ